MTTTTVPTTAALDLPDAIRAGTAAFAETYRAAAFQDGPWFASVDAAQRSIREAVKSARMAISTYLEINEVEFTGSCQSTTQLGIDVYGQDYVRPGVACFWFEDGSAIEVLFPTYNIEQGHALTEGVRVIARGDNAVRIDVEGPGYID